jgi:hypothetical protein
MSATKAGRRDALVLVACLLGGLLLTVIGIRYFLVPESAARTFGVAGRPAGYELHYIVGLRNVWLGLLAMGLAALREWRALTLWFAMASIVCFADAAIVVSSTGRPWKVAFHASCGLASVALAIVCGRVVAGRQ